MEVPVCMFQSWVRPLKLIFPKEKGYRKILFGPAAGCVMEVEPGKRVRNYLGVHEWELNGFFKRLVAHGSKCFDLGGNEGYDALMMANLSRGRVATFDFDPVMVEQLRRNIAHNPTLQIQVVESYIGSQSRNGEMTIDDAARQFFVPDFIKMDIEGAEDLALEGASETLAQRHPGMIIEVHGADKEERCLAILHRYGYRTSMVAQSWFLKESERFGHNRWLIAFPEPS
jgi:hypothetical protein